MVRGDRFLRDGSIPVARRFVRDLEMESGLGDPQVLPPDQDRINQHLLNMKSIRFGILAEKIPVPNRAEPVRSIVDLRKRDSVFLHERARPSRIISR